jgi:hypothetical protein
MNTRVSFHTDRCLRGDTPASSEADEFFTAETARVPNKHTDGFVYIGSRPSRMSTVIICANFAPRWNPSHIRTISHSLRCVIQLLCICDVE